MERIGIGAVNAMARDDFVAAFGSVFEHSPWIAADAWAARPFAHVEALHAAMAAAMRAGGGERIYALLNAHPDLAGKAALRGDVTEESQAEQASAGLDRCTAEELARLQSLNATYRDRFGFPFVMAVRGASREDILAALAARTTNTPGVELDRALTEIEKIAHLRLADLVD